MKSIPYKEYFGRMKLSERQKKQREQAAEDFEEILLLFLLSITIEQEYKTERTARDDFIRDYSEAVSKYIDDDEFVTLYVVLLAALLEETTVEHLGEEYYTSIDRAMYVAEDQANVVLNRRDYNDAVVSGYKRKRWVTEQDDRVRRTHAEIDGQTIPIDDLFVVGNAVMRFPGDLEYGADMHPEETVRCRCTVDYMR